MNNATDLPHIQCETSSNGKRFGKMREWILKKHFMPQIILQINRTQKLRYNQYLSNGFCDTEFVKNDTQFAVLETSKYPEFVFLQSSNPHNLCLHLWNDPILNRYLHQTYLIQCVTSDINFIATHPTLFITNDKNESKIIKLFGNKACISMLGPLIPKQLQLTPSEKKCTHIINIVKAYHRYYFGIFDKKYCYGYTATNVKEECKKFGDASISRAY
eukprot:UN13693